MVTMEQAVKNSDSPFEGDCQIERLPAAGVLYNPLACYVLFTITSSQRRNIAYSVSRNWHTRPSRDRYAPMQGTDIRVNTRQDQGPSGLEAIRIARMVIALQIRQQCGAVYS